jgi:hypothetical protein
MTRFYRKSTGRKGRRADSAPAQAGRACDWPGCAEEGMFRAPRSRNELRDYWWYCMEHIRQYNRTWNYYSGMTDEEVEADVRKDTVWDRPSWPFGSTPTSSSFRSSQFRDDFGLFGDGEAHVPNRPETPEARALVILDLTPPVTVAILKARYKELVKRHHPDANGGDKAAEEKFKEINEAYQTVLNTFKV